MLGSRNRLFGMIVVVLTATSAAFASDVLERTCSVGGGLLDIDTERGSVEVRNGDPGQIRVRIEVSRGSVEDFVDVRFEEGNGLRIEAKQARGAPKRGGVEFIIEAPVDIDLRLDTGGGHIEIEDVNGDVDISTGGGHIEFGEIGGSLTIGTGGGHIEGGDIGDDARIKTGGGHVETGDVGGELEIRTGGGHLEAGHVSGAAMLRSGGGHVGLDGCDSDVEVKTGGGHIELKRMGGFVYAHSGGGDIDVGLTEGNRSGVDLESDDEGDIVVRVTSGHGFNVDAVASGRVEVDASLDFSGAREVDRLSGSIGGGGSVLKVRANDGDIRIVDAR